MIEVGSRVFFKRRARNQLRSYWGHRFDALDLRRELRRPDRPRYYVKAVVLDGLYVQLRRLPYLWYTGIFRVALHRRGRWATLPVQLPVHGLGPRALVFPPTVLDRLSEIPLVGTPYRYTGRHRSREARVVMDVRRVTVGLHPPIHTGWGPRYARRAGLQLDGVFANGPDHGERLVVPVGEVLWKGLMDGTPRD